ncbi:hypothetical protein Ddc_02674 [Ditylenchus destructor]|nr:hypothetical protein Ddc_02674 [Ditylenchus destructor]
MAYILMMNVLANFDRDELEIVSITSRLFAKVVRHKFSTHPFRFFKRLDIAAGGNGAIRLRLQNANVFLLDDGSNTQQFKKPEEHPLLDELPSGDVSYCTLDQLRPFLGENVRVKNATIEMGSRVRINNGHIAEMEVIAHLWSGLNLHIIPGMIRSVDNDFLIFNLNNSSGIAPDCSFVLSSPTIVSSCHRLIIFGIDLPFGNFPILYSLKMISFLDVIEKISPVHLLEFIDGIGKHHSKTMTICCLHGDNPWRMHIESIRQAYAGSLTPNPYKAIFAQTGDISEVVQFQDVNSSTGEVLEMRALLEQEKIDVCNVIGCTTSVNIFSLERKKLKKH